MPQGHISQEYIEAYGHPNPNESLDSTRFLYEVQKQSRFEHYLKIAFEADRKNENGDALKSFCDWAKESLEAGTIVIKQEDIDSQTINSGNKKEGKDSTTILTHKPTKITGIAYTSKNEDDEGDEVENTSAYANLSNNLRNLFRDLQEISKAGVIFEPDYLSTKYADLKASTKERFK